MRRRNKQIMTYEEFVEAVRKESAELPVSKRDPESYEKEFADWKKDRSEKDYNRGDSVEACVYDIDLMV